MRFIDILTIALSALRQQKTRGSLTLLGVVLGTFILVTSLSLGRGVQDAATHVFRSNNQLRHIEVWPGHRAAKATIPEAELAVKGDMSEAKRERLRDAIIRRWNWQHLRRTAASLTPERIKAIAAIEHVTAVLPYTHESCRATFADRSEEVVSFAASPENRQLRDRLVAGHYFTADTEHSVLVHEYVLYLWGLVGDDDVGRAVGRKLRLDYRTGRRAPMLLLTLLGGGNTDMTPKESRVLQKTIQQLPAALSRFDLTADERDTLREALAKLPGAEKAVSASTVNEELTIAGVFREAGKETRLITWGSEWMSKDADIILPVRTAEDLFRRAAPSEQSGFEMVTVQVDREENVQVVVDRITDMGLDQFSLLEIFDRMRVNLVLLTFAMTFVAVVSLLVAALGITNTMVMSVLERTHEIGVMKAVGARDVHIQCVFLLEGALLGVVGGLVGLLAGWLASFPGERIARSLLDKEVREGLELPLFVFPLWLTLGMPVFACLVTTLAAVYPARRAARVSPITALRHE